MLYVLMGKSATGKDTIFKKLLEKKDLNLIKVVPYTTRPMRTGETSGKEYHFVSIERMKELETAGKIAEHRCYHTVHGDWHYFTADENLNIKDSSLQYITIGTLESYVSLRNYYGADFVTPLYICVDDFTRIRRSLAREESDNNPSCSEVCRRFLADEEDFSPDKLSAAGVEVSYENIDLDTCVHMISHTIKANTHQL